MKKLLWLIFLCCFGVLLLAQKTDNTILKNELSFTDLFNAESNDSIACYRIPALLTASNGDVIAAIDERVPNCNDLRDSRDINIVIRRSSDNGESWLPIERIIDYPDGKSASDPSMILDEQTGEIFLFFNYMDLDKEPNVYYLKYVKSKDHGQTWSEAVDITQNITNPAWHADFQFITSGRGFQTADGTLVHNLVNLQRGVHLFASKDHGENWFLLETPIIPGDESKFVELSDGRWMVNSRVAKLGMRYIHISIDQGKSWASIPGSTLIDPACNASLIKYPLKIDGKTKHLLIFSNANSKDQRINMTVRVSSDDGQTWTKGKTIYSGSSAYSSMTVLNDGNIGLFFEKEGYKENVFVKFSLEWLMDGSN